jgi:hypothetical protein
MKYTAFAEKKMVIVLHVPKKSVSISVEPICEMWPLNA